MNIITVEASQTYNVLIENGLLQNAGYHINAACKSKRAAIISDTNVFPIYGQTVIASLSAHSIACCNFIMPAGEDSKSLYYYQQILEFLVKNAITRDDILIALGGGVVGDLTGFVAATYLRGINYVQVPTSLLAMVDSSVGGKTAIDLPSGKNLVGAFHQPILVLCDPLTLNTLPESIFGDGCAEVIKYSILYDAKLFHHLAKQGIDFDRESVITRCITLKKNVVGADEFDKGERQMLNLGHTIGHSIEKCSNYAISHGNAVATGLAIIARASVAMKQCDRSTSQDIENALKIFHLPYKTDFPADVLCSAALADKKRSADIINLIIPKQIGKCIIKPTHITELKDIIEAGL